MASDDDSTNTTPRSTGIPPPVLSDPQLPALPRELQITSADQPHLMLTTSPLTGKNNWTKWKAAVEKALYIKSKECFINGTYPAPPSTDPTFRQWSTVDTLVLMWLQNSISDEIGNQFVHAASAFALWKELKDCFDKVSGPQILLLKRKIVNFTQGDMSVTSYYTALKTLWNNYRSLKPLKCKSTESLKDLMESDEEDLLIQFLMGLNEDYSHICNQILILDPLPTVSSAFGMICNCEAQNSILSSGKEDHSSNFVLAGAEKYSFNKENKTVDKGVGDRPGDKKDIICTYCKKVGHTKDRCHQLANKNSFCDHCKKSGHSRANCFLITGVIPEWYKNLGDRRKGRMIAGATVSTASSEGSDTGLSPAAEGRITKLIENTFKELSKTHFGSQLPTPVDFVGCTLDMSGPEV